VNEAGKLGWTTMPPTSTVPERQSGYAAIADYGVIGDGRTLALVALDGSIDWLCLPDIDSPSVFGALLDAERGGSFRLSPSVSFSVQRRYLPDTNLLETTFSTTAGTVRVTDCLNLPLGGLAPSRELVRRIEGLEGSVPMEWAATPSFDFGERSPRLGWRGPIPVASEGSLALGVCSWSAGDPKIERDEIGAHFRVQSGEESLLVLAIADGEPLVFPTHEEVDSRMRESASYWRRWAVKRDYTGPWRDAVLRSALTLKLLIYAPSGAIAAAATTSLPEAIGGPRNWDYRYSWIRDASATLDALIALGCPREAEAFFWWLMHASQLTHPRLRVLYGLNGGSPQKERELELAGYRGSRPARAGNGAVDQNQLDINGHIMQTAWLYAQAGGRIHRDTADRLAAIADLVCRHWRQPDSGIWEVRSAPRHFTESKMMCWIALDRAQRLAERGAIPADSASHWRDEALALRNFVAERCWSEDMGAYTRASELHEADASLLLPAMLGYGGPEEGERLIGTIRSIRERLGVGPLLYRYRGEDGFDPGEGTFTTCSFWLVDALARLGARDEAAELMAELLGRSNDLGLYAEEIDPETGEFLGNFPQALVHLALINAAATLEQER
jgi:GH15 family glucan-1,4-alpha-glucosidase